MPRDDSAQPFTTRLATAGHVAILGLTGELDLATRDQATQAFDAALAEGPQTLVVSLHDLDFMDSTGIHFLLGAKTRSARAGVRMIVLNGSGPAHRTLELAGALDAFELIDDPNRIPGDPAS